MANSNEYMRDYMLSRFRRRKLAAIAQLGGCCVRCGGTDTEDLQFDHIDPSSKEFSVGRALAGVSEAKLQAELVKCQLLCQDCHTVKTVETDLGRTLGKGSHGSEAAYRYCGPPKCGTCRAARRAAMAPRNAARNARGKLKQQEQRSKPPVDKAGG